MRAVAFLVLTFALLGGVTDRAAALDLTAGEVADLNDFFRAANGELTEAMSRRLKSKVSSPSCPVAGLASAILFASDPPAHGEPLYKVFSVHDYVERSKNKYNLIAPETVKADIGAIESRYAKELTSKALMVLLTYCHYRNGNEWLVLKNGERLSTARFFRSGFLGLLYKEKNIDVLELANGFDERAKREDLGR